MIESTMVRHISRREVVYLRHSNDRRAEQLRSTRILVEPDAEGVNLSDADVVEFGALYERLAGIQLESDAAREKATALLLFVRALISPSTSQAQRAEHDVE